MITRTARKIQLVAETERALTHLQESLEDRNHESTIFQIAQTVPLGIIPWYDGSQSRSTGRGYCQKGFQKTPGSCFFPSGTLSAPPYQLDLSSLWLDAAATVPWLSTELCCYIVWRVRTCATAWLYPHEEHHDRQDWE